MISIGNPCNHYILMKDTEYNKKKGNSYKLKLRRCDWTKDNLKEFINIFDYSHTKDDFNNISYNIIDYGLHFNEVKELNFESPENYHEIGLKNFFNGKIKNEPQNLVDLIKSLEKMNKDLKNNAITEDLLKELKNSYKIDEETKRIANDNKQEKELIIKYVKDWAKKAKEQKSKNINEIIVHINLLFGVIFKYHLRPTQIISVLVLLKRNDIKLGRNAQILTGEGKTAIIITLAATNVILGHKVDIVTSSELLAKRDAIDERNKELYNSLGITVDHCIKDDNNKKDHGPKECYNADIVYGDTHNFQADILSDKYMLENTRNGRKYDMIIVDEIDSMFVDDYGKSTLLAGEKPYMKRLNYILIGMWVKLSVSVRGETKNTIRYNIKEIESELTKVGLNILNNKSLKLPRYLHDYAEHEMEKWAHSAVEAILMEENVRYRVNGDRIEPIDNENTGVIQHNTNLSYGLQQFLQLKHNCTLTSVSTITSYLSNVGFFNLYKNEKENNIIGLTGTLGSETAQSMLNKIYGLDFAFIPPASERMLIQLLPRLEKNDIDWLNTVTKTCLREAKFGREVLIICKSIKIVEKIHSELINLYDKNKIITLKDDLDIEKNLENLPGGTIIIATNLAGRGTDISISDEVLKKGGLHVCLTFLPINIRVQEQAFGRAGRKGQPGTWQLVLNLFKNISEICHVDFPNDNIDKIVSKIQEYTSLESELVRNCYLEEGSKVLTLKRSKGDQITEKKIEIKNLSYELYNLIQEMGEINNPNSPLKKLPIFIEDLDFIREENEKKMLLQAESEIEKVVKKDKLFIKYTDFLKNNLKNLEPRSNRFNDIEEQWGFFLNKIDYEKQTEEQINKAFIEFTTDLQKRKEQSTYLKNSGFICQIANSKLYNNIPNRDDASILENIGSFFKKLFTNNDEQKKREAQVDEALNLCKYDIEVNGDFSFISYYYRAICSIYFGDIGNAILCLKKTKELIEKDIKFFINFCSMLPNDIKNFKESINKKFILYMNIIKGIAEPSINKLEKASRKILLKKKFLSEVFDKTPKDLRIEKEINDLRIIGFNSIFFLYEKAPWYVALGISVLGILEVGVGCLVSCVSPQLGVRIINTGITNIGKGIEMLIGEGKGFEDIEAFWNFQEANGFMDFLVPLKMKRDEKKKYNFYEMELKNDTLLKEKIILRRSS